MRLTGVSLASLWRPLYSFIILIIYLVYILLLKLLDLGNLKSQYKAFRLFYYLIYSCYIIRLASLFYPKAQGNYQDFNQVVFAEYFYANIFSQPISYPNGSFLYLLVPQGNSNISAPKVLDYDSVIDLFANLCKDFFSDSNCLGADGRGAKPETAQYTRGLGALDNFILN